MTVLYAVAIFLSAFLLFQVQPIIAKMILPWFGGSASVWNTCMLFFQTALLGGYLYAHWLHERLSPRKQAWVHTSLLLASLAALPILPDASWKPLNPENPSLRILGLLAWTVGLPYFLLSSTSPLLQAWYTRTQGSAVPYRLFALSNLASMLALISYLLLVEPNLSTGLQGRSWSAGYVCFVLLCGWTAWRVALRTQSRQAGSTVDERDPSPPGWGLRALWLTLAACASILLLAITTYLTQDVAVIPFLWILPLVVYLLSFIVCFEAPRLYRRSVFLPLGALALAGMAYRLSILAFAGWMGVTITLLVAALFICCMVCHGELARRKPHPRYLTGFYVMVSLGGATGGLFVGLLAPNLFNGYYEFPIGLALCATLIVVVLLIDNDGWFRTREHREWRNLLLAALGIYLIVLGVVVRNQIHPYRVVVRNFYGQLHVADVREPDEEPYRKLVHGVINHGQQLLNEPYRRQPATYFCPGTGVGLAMATRKEGSPMRVGILGLGCGTLLSYGRPGDTFRLYEINPLVLDLARREFTYLGDTAAKVEVVLGDGRLSLEREPSQQFDVLVMDAFSGDSVPVHLLTREAFRSYFRHLKPGGILAVNISNRYLELKPVMERSAREFGKVALAFDYEPEYDDTVCFSATWALIVDPTLRNTAYELFRSGVRIRPAPKFRIWTDDFSNLFRILK